MIVVCGEALVDLVRLPGEPRAYAALPGGGPASTAVALARLGTPVQLLARLSGDDFGTMLRAHLAGNGVGLDLAARASEPTALAVAGVDEHGAARYAFYLDGTADRQWSAGELPATLPPGTRAIHAGSLSLALAPGADRLHELLTRSRPAATVMLDPNVRPAVLDGLDIGRWLPLADLVKASDDDLALLHPGRDPLDAARSWIGAGPAVVVVTRGREGAVAVTGERTVEVPAPAVEVVDTVGAGDAFGAALLHALDRGGALGGRLDRLDADLLRRALGFAARAAAVTCTRRGADPPRGDELPPW
ncbi:MAG: carbohydrate kinase family protein [Frankiaceae bacterium]